MKFYFTLLLLFVVRINSSGQSKIDSLKSILKNQVPDSVRIDINLRLNSMVSDDTAASKQYLREAIALSVKANDLYRLSRCYMRQASRYEFNGNIDAAKQVLLRIKKLLRNFRNAKIEAGSSMYLGIINYYEGSYDSAVYYLWDAVRLYEKLGDSITVASCYINIGNCYKELEDYSNTLKYYLLGMNIYDQQGYEAGFAMATGNLGNVYKKLGDTDLALKYYYKSLEVHRRNGSEEDLRINLNNIGELYINQKEWEKSLPYLRESLEIAERIHSEMGILVALHNIAVVDMEHQHYSEALKKFNTVLDRARKAHFRENVEETLKSISIVYERMGKFDKALIFRKKYEEVRDSLINDHHLTNVKELELKYETDKKNQQIQLLGKENEIRQVESKRQATLKNTFVIGTILSSLLAIVIAYTLRQRLKNQTKLSLKNVELKEAMFKQQLSDLEMRALRAQINPHFLFNCMNSINRLIMDGDNKNASLYLTKLSKLLRMILENTETGRVSLDNELLLIESYIQMEELRFKSKIDYEIHIDQAVEREAIHLPSMVLQPFVENAIWHGLMHKTKEEYRHIKIEVKESNDLLVFAVEDNGVGRERSRELQEKNTYKTKSMGMKITEERLRLLSKEKIAELIRIVDLKDCDNLALGTRVEICIPLI